MSHLDLKHELYVARDINLSGDRRLGDQNLKDPFVVGGPCISLRTNIPLGFATLPQKGFPDRSEFPDGDASVPQTY